MKIILVSVGTRGDMEPFLAVGQILLERGHRVICAFPEQFRDLVEGSTMEFASLGAKYIESLASDSGKAAMGGRSGLEKVLATLKLARRQTEANKELAQKQYRLIEKERPDRIVYNGKAIYPVIWELDHPGKTVLLSPVPYVHHVRDHAHLAFTNSNFGPLVNKLTYAVADFGLITTAKIAAGWVDLTPSISRKEIRDALLSNKVIYMISPSLFSRPVYWRENIRVLGYQPRRKTTDWQVDSQLNEFLERHKNDRILFVTFGSMLNSAPREKTRIIVDILQRNKIPAIINTAAGGLVVPDEFDSELLHFVSRIPYDWILPKVYGVVHHGGSGTTHLALRYGCASLIIPHVIDQYVWAEKIADLGVGPDGVKISKVKRDTLEPKILDLVHNLSFKQKAKQVAAHMAMEDFREDIYQTIISR